MGNVLLTRIFTNPILNHKLAQINHTLPPVPQIRGVWVQVLGTQCMKQSLHIHTLNTESDSKSQTFQVGNLDPES